VAAASLVSLVSLVKHTQYTSINKRESICRERGGEIPIFVTKETKETKEA